MAVSNAYFAMFSPSSPCQPIPRQPATALSGGSTERSRNSVSRRTLETRADDARRERREVGRDVGELGHFR